MYRSVTELGEEVKLHPFKHHTKLRGKGLAAIGEENIAFSVCLVVKY